MKRSIESIYGTKRWRSYALCNAGMAFESAGELEAAASLYISALEDDEGNIVARMNLGALLLESEGIRSAMKQLQIAKHEAVVKETAENHAVYYTAAFRLAAGIHQQGDLEGALEEVEDLRDEIARAIRGIRKRCRPGKRRIRLWVLLRRIPGGRKVAARLRHRAHRQLRTEMENEGRFQTYLQELRPSVAVMIAGIRKEMGKKVDPPRIADRDLWRPSSTLQYNLACAAAVWLKDAQEHRKRARAEQRAASAEAHRHHGDKRVAALEHENAAHRRATRWEGEVTRWTEDALGHLELALRLNPRMSLWAKNDRSMVPLKKNSQFKTLIERYKPAPRETAAAATLATATPATATPTAATVAAASGATVTAAAAAT